MKKLSRRERKAYEEGRAAGYAEGYKNGLYDGNPFNAIIDGLKECINVVADAVKNDPELLKQIQEQNNYLPRCWDVSDVELCKKSIELGYSAGKTAGRIEKAKEMTPDADTEGGGTSE